MNVHLKLHRNEDLIFFSTHEPKVQVALVRLRNLWESLACDVSSETEADRLGRRTSQK